MTSDELWTEIGRHVDLLMEHCESVRIIVTAQLDETPNSTDTLTQGDGNYYAQYGSVRKWLLHEERDIKMDEIP